jgi:CRP/FNR family cyclic AMP-dependent transcriptional regulator
MSLSHWNSPVLEKVSLFAGLNNKQISTLEKSAGRITFAKNSVVFHKGDKCNCLYVILRGSAKAVRQDESGRQVILNRFGVCEYFGEMSFLDGSPRCATVLTRRPCEMLTIPRSAFLKLVSDNSGIYRNITNFLLNKLRSATQQIEDLAISTVYFRLARLLSENQGPKGVLTDNFTHQELAEMVGATRETICRLINDLICDGYLSRKGSNLVIVKKLPYHFR